MPAFGIGFDHYQFVVCFERPQKRTSDFSFYHVEPFKMEISRENSANLAGEELIQSVFMLTTISHLKYFTLQSNKRNLSVNQ